MPPVLIQDLRINDSVTVTYSPACVVTDRKKVGVIVNILPAGKEPSKELILRYYGPEAEKPRYSSVFKATKTDRVIIKYGKESYGIYPISELTQRNIRFKKEK